VTSDAVRPSTTRALGTKNCRIVHLGALDPVAFRLVC
jgi:hypothetical protein